MFLQFVRNQGNHRVVKTTKLFLQRAIGNVQANLTCILTLFINMHTPPPKNNHNSLIPRPLPDFLTPVLQIKKIWEWPGNEANECNLTK